MSEPEQPDVMPPDRTPEAAVAAAESAGIPAALPPSREPATERDERRSGRVALVFAIIALLLALIALAGAAVVGWGGYQLRGEQARVAELEGRVAALEGRVAALNSSAARVGEVTRLQASLKNYEQSRSQQAAAVATALHALEARMSGAGNAWREDEAATLMRLAQARLDLAYDPAGAAQALRLADQALAAADEPAFAPVRAELAREIAALAAVPKPDVTGTYVRLNALAARVDDLPLAGERVAAPPTATVAKPSVWSWSGAGAAFKRAFGSLVVVWHGPNARPLLPPREAYFVRANLKLALASAQLALLQRNTIAYRASLKRARNLLETWFAGDAPGVRHALGTLKGAAALNPAPPLPKLGAALARLQAARNETAPR